MCGCMYMNNVMMITLTSVFTCQRSNFVISKSSDILMGFLSKLAQQLKALLTLSNRLTLILAAVTHLYFTGDSRFFFVTIGIINHSLKSKVKFEFFNISIWDFNLLLTQWAYQDWRSEWRILYQAIFTEAVKTRQGSWFPKSSKTYGAFQGFFCHFCCHFT